MTLGTVPWRSRAASELDCVAPDHFAGVVIFANASIPFMTDQVVPILELSHHPRVAMRIGFVHSQLNFLHNLSILIHFDDPFIPGFGNQRVAVGQSLKRMNLDRSLVTSFWLGLLFPDDLFLGRHLGYGRGSGVQQKVAVRQKVNVV